MEKHMPFNEKVFLSPQQKYRKFSKFPWKLILHVVLILLTTYQVYFVCKGRATTQRIMKNVFREQLIEEEFSNQANFYDIPQFQEHFETVQDFIGNIDQKLLPETTIKESKIVIDVYYQEYQKNPKQTLTFDVTKNFQDFKKPFDIKNAQSIREFFGIAQQFKVTITDIKTWYQVNQNLTHDPFGCYVWDIILTYNYNSDSYLTVNMDVLNSYCIDDIVFNNGINYLFIHILVVIFSLLSLYLTLLHFHHTGAQYMLRRYQFQIYKEKVQQNVIDQKLDENTIKEFFEMEFDNDNEDEQTNFRLSQEEMKKLHEQHPHLHHHTNLLGNNIQKKLKINYDLNWDQINFVDKLQFFNTFYMFGIIGNFFQIMGAIVAIIEIAEIAYLQVFSFKEALMGLGCGIQWFVMLNYLKYDETTSLMNETLGLAGPSLVYFMIGCLPIIMGFAYLSMMVFTQEQYFETVTDSIILLVAMGLGDIIYDVFTDTYSTGVVGHIFLMMFLIFFYTAVQNVFVALIMDCYDDIQDEKAQQLQKSQNLKKKKLEYYESHFEKGEHIQQLISDLPKEALSSEFVQNRITLEDTKPLDVADVKLKSNMAQINKLLDQYQIILQLIEDDVEQKEDKQFLYKLLQQKLQNLTNIIHFQKPPVSNNKN